MCVTSQKYRFCPLPSHDGVDGVQSSTKKKCRTIIQKDYIKNKTNRRTSLNRRRSAVRRYNYIYCFIHKAFTSNPKPLMPHKVHASQELSTVSIPRV